MRRPTFFLSSTIYDFRDLRSAIKHFLEQRGCTVMASEFNDFRKPLDAHSYEACLRSIEQCDYFILLVGSRVGGWFDQAGQVSITQREYQAAYELHRVGKLKIVTLVGREVWDFRDNHKALEAHLRGLELDGDVARTIARYPTKFAEDANFVIRFIEEIGRNAETKAALGSAGPFPTGNWVHVFETFRDVADVLGTLLLGGLPVEEAAFRRALRHELVELLRDCLLKVGGRAPIGPRRVVEQFRADVGLTRDHRWEGTVVVPTRSWDRFSTVMMGLLGRDLRTSILGQALASPTFLEFDPASGTPQETDAFRAIHRLGEEVEGALMGLRGNVLSAIFAYTPKARGGYSPAEIEIRFEELAPLLGLAQRWANIVELAAALIAHLDGAPFTWPTLMPRSPVAGMDEELDRERSSDTEVMAFVLMARSPDGAGP